MAENTQMAQALSSPNIDPAQVVNAFGGDRAVSSVSFPLGETDLTPEEKAYNEEQRRNYNEQMKVYNQRLLEYNNALSSGKSEYTVTDTALSPYQQGLRAQMGVDPATNQPRFSSREGNDYVPPLYSTTTVKVADMKAPIAPKTPDYITPKNRGNISLGTSNDKDKDGGSNKENWANMGFTPVWDVLNEETSKITTDIYGMKEKFNNLDDLAKSLIRVANQDHIFKDAINVEGNIKLLNRKGEVADENVTSKSLLVRAVDMMDNAYWELLRQNPTKDGKPRIATGPDGQTKIIEFTEAEIADMRTKGAQGKRDAAILSNYYRLVGGQTRSKGLINLTRFSEANDPNNNSVGVAVSLGDAFAGNTVADGFKAASLIQAEAALTNSTMQSGESMKQAKFSLHFNTSALADALSEMFSLYIGNADELAEKYIRDMYGGKGETVKPVPLSQKKSVLNKFWGINAIQNFYDLNQFNETNALTQKMAQVGALKPNTPINVMSAFDMRLLNTMASKNQISLNDENGKPRFNVSLDEKEMLNSGLSKRQMSFQAFMNYIMKIDNDNAITVLSPDAEVPVQYNSWNKTTNFIPNNYRATSIVRNDAMPTFLTEPLRYRNKLDNRR